MTSQSRRTEGQAKWLLVTVRNGKIGMRVANTLEGAVAPYNAPTATLSRRDRKRLHLPSAVSEQGNGSANLCTTSLMRCWKRRSCRQIRCSALERTIYSLCHTAICMRIILSHAKVNILWWAESLSTQDILPAPIRERRLTLWRSPFIPLLSVVWGLGVAEGKCE